MSDDERLVTVQGCKFVDEVRRRCARRASRSAWPRRAPRAQVVPECPYVMNDEYLTMIFDKYKIDYVVHGDDPCIVDGKVRPQQTDAPPLCPVTGAVGRRMCTRTRSTWANTARSREPKAFRPQTLSAECCCSRATTTTRSAHLSSATTAVQGAYGGALAQVEAPTTRSKSKSTATLVSKGKRMNRPSNFLTTCVCLFSLLSVDSDARSRSVAAARSNFVQLFSQVREPAPPWC